MCNTSFHTTNLVTEEVKQEMREIKHEVMHVGETILHAVAHNTVIMQDLTNHESQYNPYGETQETAKYAAQNNRNNEIMKMMIKLQQELQQMKQNIITPNPTYTPQPNPNMNRQPYLGVQAKAEAKMVEEEVGEIWGGGGL
jgi:hypothetical protein